MSIGNGLFFAKSMHKQGKKVDLGIGNGLFLQNRRITSEKKYELEH